MKPPSPAGYFGKPLHAKLGFKPGWSVHVVGAPGNHDALLAGADGVMFEYSSGGMCFDAAHVFLKSPEELPDAAADAIGRLRPGGMPWLSWTKKSSPLFSGITEDDLRAHVLPLGWVDVKVCAMDADCSGLKSLRRKG